MYGTSSNKKVDLRHIHTFCLWHSGDTLTVIVAVFLVMNGEPVLGDTRASTVAGFRWGRATSVLPHSILP